MSSEVTYGLSSSFNQQLLIIAGAAANQSTMDLYGLLKDREVQLSLASYRQLPVDIAGDDSALNRKFLESILGLVIDAQGTALIILRRGLGSVPEAERVFEIFSEMTSYGEKSAVPEIVLSS